MHPVGQLATEQGEHLACNGLVEVHLNQEIIRTPRMNHALSLDGTCATYKVGYVKAHRFFVRLALEVTIAAT